jgi:hypothetical protein
MLDLGWGRLAEEPNQFFVAGAVCQPWRADVVFSTVAPERFAAFAEPDRVKIAWTLEIIDLGPSPTRFAAETRMRFRRYWRKFGIGAILIRRLLLAALRRDAERRWRRLLAGRTVKMSS